MANKNEGFFASVNRERKKIQWPDKKTTMQYTSIVLVISAITGVVIWALDLVFKFLLETLL